MMGLHVNRSLSTATVFLFAATLVAMPPLPSPAQSGTLKGVVVDGDGMHTATFKTSKGDVIVHLPDDMAAGDTISGTVAIEPAGKTNGERAANGGTLNGYVVELGKQSTAPGGKTLRWYVHRMSVVADLALRDANGNVIGQAQVPVAPRGGTASPEPVIPKLIVVGKPWIVRGAFHPETHDAKITLNGDSAPVLAESPRQIICANPSTKPGPQPITVQETPRNTAPALNPTPKPLDPPGKALEGPSQVTRGVANNIDLKLSAPKTTLVRGEKTTLHVQVSGLDGIGGPVPLHIKNESILVLSLGGGNEQRSLIRTADVKSGKYDIDRTLTGIQPGPFSIFAEITPPVIMRSENVADNSVDDCLKLLKAADDLDAQALKLRQQAAEFRDKANAAYGEYLILFDAASQLKNKQPIDVMDERKQVADSYRRLAGEATQRGDAATAAKMTETADRVDAQAKDVAARMKAAGVSNPPVAGDGDRMMTAALALQKEAQTYNNLADKLTKQADDLNAQANKLRDQAVCKSAG